MSKPVRIEALTFEQVMEEARKAHDEEVARFNAMTPEEQEQYILKQRQEEEEMEKVLEELRKDGGFMEISIPTKEMEDPEQVKQRFKQMMEGWDGEAKGPYH